ncbi:MAG: hypothetical protein U5L03_01075 [Burkholderiaceae bacterium]|nr:hypothetical protein [Burkholderiaceae bacterium]
MPLAPPSSSQLAGRAARARAGRHRDHRSGPTGTAPVERRRDGVDLVGCAGGDHFAAVHAGTRAHVDHVIGSADRVLVVLDHEHGVAEVAQALEGADQSVVVALVQADRGLVQHVHHAGQARADLRRQADALRLRRRDSVSALRSRVR